MKTSLPSKLFWCFLILFVATILTEAWAGSDSLAPETKHLEVGPPSAAPVGRWYVAAFGGADLFQTGTGHLPDPTGGSSTADLQESKSIPGGVGGLKVGYEFPAIGHVGSDVELIPAIEVEGFYSGFTYASNAFNLNPVGWAVSNFQIKANVNSYNLLANAILKARIKGNLEPYIGVGAGVSYLDFHNERFITPDFGGFVFPMESPHDTTASLQALAGCAYHLTDNLSLFCEYKYVQHLDASVNSVITPATVPIQVDFNNLAQHLLVMGIKWGF